MNRLKANARLVAICVAALLLGGWLIFLTQAAGNGDPSPSLQAEQPDGKNLPRLDRATPEASDRRAPRWASTPMPPPAKDGPNLPAHGPVVVPSASSAVVGTEITIRGQDFVPQSWVTVEIERAGANPTIVAEGLPVNRDGSFAVPFQPGAELLPGDYVVVARFGAGEARAQLKLVGAKPVAQVDPSAAKPGQELDFFGGGFAPGEEVSMYLDSLASVPFLVARAGDRGSVANSFVVPMAAEGEHTLVALGVSSRVLLRAQFTVIGFYPWVDLSSYASQPEIHLDFAGHNFAPGEGIWVFMDEFSGMPVGRATADQDGEFTLPGAYFVPPSLRGDHKFFFVGDVSQRSVEATFAALPYNPSVTLSTYAGKPGSRISLDGEGFARGETLRAYWGETADGVLLSQSRAGPDGSFRGWDGIAVPYDADIMKGGANITVLGELSQASAGTWFTLVALTPSAELNKYDGPPGETLRFSGNGFAPSERVIVTLADRPDILAEAQADDEGAFANAGNFTVPPDQSQDLEFVFTGALSDARAQTHYRVRLPGEVEVTPTPEALHDGPCNDLRKYRTT